MTYSIRYAGTCFRGLVRRNNEDNLFLDGTYLPKNRRDTENIQEGAVPASRCPILGVFDGMGGLQAGEAASFLAARQLGWWNRRKNRFWGQGRWEQFIDDLCQDMNESILEYAGENRIRDMGTTMAVGVFGRNGLRAVNLGDSSIYCFAGGKLEKVSQDHVLNVPGYRKAPLTQYLGLGEEEGRIEPHIRNLSYENEMQILFCTDGATDMLPEKELTRILEKEEALREKVDEMKESVLKKGAFDNTTIVLVQVSGRPGLFSGT